MRSLFIRLGVVAVVGLLASVVWTLIVAVHGAAPTLAAVCDDRDVIGPFTATVDNAGQCRGALLGQVDCKQLCAEGECAQQIPLFKNECLNIATLFTNLQWFRETRTCTVDAIHCVCRCADSAPGRGRGLQCGDGELDPGEDCDPAITLLAVPLRSGSPEVEPSQCPAGGVCNDDCTCGEPPLCGNMIIESGEECDPPGTICGSVCDPDCHTVSCSSACTCCGDAQIGPGERCDPPGVLCTACDEGGCFSSVCSEACGCERP